jgi:hypothetical protein
MRPPSSQHANLSGVGLEVGSSVAVGDKVGVGLAEGDGDGVIVEIVFGVLVPVAVCVAGLISTIGVADTQAEIIAIKVSVIKILRINSSPAPRFVCILPYKKPDAPNTWRENDDLLFFSPANLCGDKFSSQPGLNS